MDLTWGERGGHSFGMSRVPGAAIPCDQEEPTEGSFGEEVQASMVQ
jgi:hypothetical protein